MDVEKMTMDIVRQAMSRDDKSITIDVFEVYTTVRICPYPTDKEGKEQC